MCISFEISENSYLSPPLFSIICGICLLLYLLLLDSLFLSCINLFINATQSTSIASYYRDAASKKVIDDKSTKERNHPSSYDSHRFCDLISDRFIIIDRTRNSARCRNTPPSSERGNNGTCEFSRCASRV